MGKTTIQDVTLWVGIVSELIRIGATTYSAIARALINDGAAADDERLRALDAEYARRIQMAGGGGNDE